MILKQKARNQLYYWYWNSNMPTFVAPKPWLSYFWWQSTNKITGTQHHHKLIFYSSFHVQRVLIVTTKVEQGTIRVGNKRLLMITGAPIASKFTQREMSCHHQWYLFLLHWIIYSSIHLSCPQLVNSHPDIHRTLLMITGDLIAKIVTQRAMSFHHRLYLCLLHWTNQSLIHFSCPWLVNSHPALHITQCMSCKLLQYPVRLHLIRQIPCHHRPPIMEVAIFMDTRLMCLSWHRHNDNRMP